MIIRSVDSSPRSVAELVELTRLSAVTVRRDLADLAEQGLLVRTRGGAAPAVRRGAEYPFGLREASEADTKRRLARAAATIVEPGHAVLIDNGTTALAVARELAGLGITAMALSLHAAAALAAVPGNQVLVPGGPVDTDDLAFTSAGAADAVRAMRFDVAFIGACAAHPDHGLTVATWGDAHLKRAALDSSTERVLVATADKFHRTAAHRFGRIGDITTIVTTADAAPSVLYDARESGARILTVSPTDPPHGDARRPDASASSRGGTSRSGRSTPHA
ncbi:DeoR/GlpR family DNA-binding transcription regulator [Microbacterium sp. YJN-G]|uniref:DeoR/GlpR family DNA-binding transcription regulator n=1 Tax=Microbacterium sp. YJN-G TaxID=2763257 RepID=UPI0018778726|nr:DeoR/GlpR family DNA-binding transcription regulator [Microbacterium sp. YJN-G]